MGVAIRPVTLSCYALLIGLGGDRPSAGSGGDVAEPLRAEATRIEAKPASDLFAAIEGGAEGASLGLSPGQIALSRRLDRMVRAVLARSPDAGEGPGGDGRAERLAGRDARDRELIVASAEALAVQTILSPAQVKRLRAVIGRMPSAPIADRYGPFRTGGDPRIVSVERFESSVRTDLHYLGKGKISLLFWSASRGSDADRPLSGSQARLAEDLETLCCDLLRPWLERDVLRGGAAVDQWEAPRIYGAWDRHRSRAVALCESIFLRGILSPAQADAVLVNYWRANRPLALMDPELGSRLQLSRAQKPKVVQRLRELERLKEELPNNVDAAPVLDASGRDLVRMAHQERLRVLSGAEASLFDVLTPAQGKQFEGLVGGGESRGPSSGASRRPPRSG